MGKISRGDVDDEGWKWTDSLLMNISSRIGPLESASERLKLSFGVGVLTRISD